LIYKAEFTKKLTNLYSPVNQNTQNTKSYGVWKLHTQYTIPAFQVSYSSTAAWC